MGSITEITNSAGSTIQAYLYDSYGNIIQSTGVLENPFTYTGREFDEESGLYYLRTREYDASNGRFLQEDQIGFLGMDINLYRYILNNPVNGIDPFGEAGWSVAACDVMIAAQTTSTVFNIDEAYTKIAMLEDKIKKRKKKLKKENPHRDQNELDILFSEDDILMDLSTDLLKAINDLTVAEGKSAAYAILVGAFCLASPFLPL